MTGMNRVGNEEYRFDNCVIRSDTRELLRDGVAQKIERRSFDLILYLIKLDGRVASKDELLEHVWGNRYVSDSVIAQSIMKVRKALGITGKEPGPIKTIHRVGYRFIGDVHAMPGSAVQLAQAGGKSGPPAVLWLPTDCPAPEAGVSWVRYGLISVAAHILQSQGVSVASAGEAIRLYEAADADNPVLAISNQLRAQGEAMGVVGSRLTVLSDQYQLDWQLYVDGVRYANQVKGESPAEMALVAAQEIALLARLHAAQSARLDPRASFRDDIDPLLSLAESLHQVERLAPLLARCADLPQCPLRVLAAFVDVLAQRTDPTTPGVAERLVERARETGEPGYEGWARLCLAKFHLYAGDAGQARQQALAALVMVRRHATGALLGRALLLAAHVLAMLGQHADAQALLQDAEPLVGHQPTHSLSCLMQLRRCELAYLSMDITTAGQPFADALAAAQRLGFQSSEAWLGVFCAMQCCALGDFNGCRQHLEAARVAGEQSGSPRALIYATLQLGNYHARTGDQEGLEQCLGRLGDPHLRNTAMGTAAWHWLRARHLLLTGHARDALPLAEQAMGQLAHLGLWWTEDHWLFIAQLALLCGNRPVVEHVLERLAAQRHQHPLAPRRATLLAVQGMLAHFDGEQARAMHLFEQAHELGSHTLMAQVLLPGLVWLALMNGRQPTVAQLSAAGDWSDQTPEGRHVQAVVQRQSQWGDALRQKTLILGTGTDHPMPVVVSDVSDAALIRYTDYLPLPV